MISIRLLGLRAGLVPILVPLLIAGTLAAQEDRESNAAMALNGDLLSGATEPRILYPEPLELTYINPIRPGGVCGISANGSEVCVGEIPRRGSKGEDLAIDHPERGVVTSLASYLRTDSGIKVWRSDSREITRNLHHVFDSPRRKFQEIWVGSIFCKLDAGSRKLHCLPKNFATALPREISMDSDKGWVLIDTIPEAARIATSEAQLCWFLPDTQQYQCWYGFLDTSLGIPPRQSKGIPVEQGPQYFPHMPEPQIRSSAKDIMLMSEWTCFSEVDGLNCRWRDGLDSAVPTVRHPSMQNATLLTGNIGIVCGKSESGVVECRKTFAKAAAPLALPDFVTQSKSAVKSLRARRIAACVHSENNDFGCWHLETGARLALPQKFWKVRSFQLEAAHSGSIDSDILCAESLSGDFDCFSVRDNSENSQFTIAESPLVPGVSFRTYAGSDCLTTGNRTLCLGMSALDPLAEGTVPKNWTLVDLHTDGSVYCPRFRTPTGEQGMVCTGPFLPAPNDSTPEQRPFFVPFLLPADTTRVAVRPQIVCYWGATDFHCLSNVDNLPPKLFPPIRTFHLLPGPVGQAGMALDREGLTSWPMGKAMFRGAMKHFDKDPEGLIDFAPGKDLVCGVWESGIESGKRNSLSCDTDGSEISGVFIPPGFDNVQSVLASMEVVCASLPAGVACVGRLEDSRSPTITPSNSSERD